MTRMSSKRLFPIGLAIALAVALVAGFAAACGGSDDKGVSNELAPNQELRVRIAGDPSTLDPQLASVAEEISVVKQLFRGLFAYDEQLNVVPSVAREMPTKENGGISQDGLTYTIKLRNDATWSDGQAVVAGDFAYAFQRLFDPNGGGQGYYVSFYTSIQGGAEVLNGEAAPDSIGVKALDDEMLQITLTHEQPTLPTLLALWPASPLRKDVIDANGAAWTEPGKLIGNGPFVLSEYALEDKIVLDATADYWGTDKPTLERMVYRIIPEDSAALIAYENGEIDMTSIPPADASRFEGDAEQVRYAQLETFAVMYNSSAEPFDDALVRQAFGRAIDREAYVSAVLGGLGTAALSWLPPDMPGGNAAVGEALGFNPEAARSLLSEAGYEDGEGFPSVTLTIVDDDTNRLTAEFLQEQLSQNLGVDIDIESLEEGTFFDRYSQGDFQVTYLSWFADYADPENWLPEQFGSQGSLNVLGYSNPEVDELLEQAAIELDQQERLALYDQAHRLIIEDQAVSPVYHPEHNYLVKSHVAGLVTTALDAQPGDWFVSNVRILKAGDAAPPASDPDE